MNYDYKCPRCGYETKYKGNLKRHIERIKLCIPVLSTIDVKRFKNQLLTGVYIENIENKNNVEHIQDNTYKCNKCDKIFNRSDNLKRHIKTCKIIEHCKTIDDKNDDDNGIFYIIHEREYVRMKEDIYKIGVTKRSILKRFKEYPEGSRIHFVHYLLDPYTFETKIKKIFKQIFKSGRGTERFEGPVTKMIDIVISLL